MFYSTIVIRGRRLISLSERKSSLFRNNQEGTIGLCTMYFPFLGEKCMLLLMKNPVGNVGGFRCMFIIIDTDEIPRFFLLEKKSYLHRAQWRYYFYLSRVRILVSPWLLTWLANMIRILTFWNRNYKYYCLYFSFITLYASFITFLWQAFCDRWPL